MRINVVIVLTLALTSLNACAQSVRLQVQVHDEDGKPVESAHVRGLFFNDQVLKKQDLASHRGLTGSDGQVEVSGHDELYVDLIVKKDGYYKSKKRHSVRGKSVDQVDVLLRQKRNPIAMYAKQVRLVIPERGREYGFDFLKGDFVLAGHDGSQADIKIKLDKELIKKNNFTQTLKLTFSNPTDGVVEMKVNKEWKKSDFKTPYYAPLEGYDSNIKLTYTRDSSGAKKENIDVPFFIRIRSTKDEDGNIENAYYCKIPSGVSLFGVLADKSSLKMTYYCNPTPNDRNVEFDPKQNLLKDLKETEEIWVP